MPAVRLADMTWEEVRNLDRSRAVALLPVGAVEAHGPHLPLGTDLIIAEAMAEAGARCLSDEGRQVLVLPPLAYTPAEFARRFPGTVGVAPETVTRSIVEVAAALTRQGFPVLGIANAHLDPAHLGALHEAVGRADRAGLLPIAFPDLTRRPWALRLGEEFRSGACHAGRYEGSIVLARRPDLVREEIRRSLSPNPRSLAEAIREGLSGFEEAGGPSAYFGFPAEATAEEGEVRIVALGKILAEAVAEALGKPGVRRAAGGTGEGGLAGDGRNAKERDDAS